MTRGKTLPRPVETPSAPNPLQVSFRARIHNKFLVEVIDADTGELKQKAQAFNTVLNKWWDYPDVSIDNLSYGRGSGTPSPSDTKLFDPIASPSVSGSVDTSTFDQGYISYSCSVQLGPSTAVGENITEVGLCKHYSSGNYRYVVLVTHAMLQDMNGNPISIHKTDTDIINIYGTVFLHFDPVGYQNGSILQAEGSSFLGRFCGGYSYSSDNKIKLYGSALFNNDSTGESSAPAVSAGTPTWDKATKTYKIPFGRAAVTTANVAGGLCMLYFVSHSGILGSSAAEFFTIRPTGLSSILGEAVGTGDGETSQFQTKFNFPLNATVYVDGVAKTEGVSVFPDCPYATSMHRYFLRLSNNCTKDRIFASALQSSSSRSIGANSTAFFEYLFYNAVPISNLTFAATNVSLYASDDLDQWDLIGTTGSSTTSRTLEIPEAYGNKRYWKVVTKSNAVSISGGQGKDLNTYAIRFDEPPANGSVITIDYDTPMIPKDEDHVMDMSLSFQLGDYTG